METFLLALRLVTPMCIFMIIGYMLQRKNFFTEQALAGINKFLFKFILPINIAKSIYSSNIRNGGNWNVIIFVMCATTVLNLICAVVMPRLESDRRKIPVMIQGVAKSNYVLIGLSMVAMIYGDNIGMAGVMVAATALFNNTFSTIFFEYYRGKKISVGSFIKKIVTNPLVMSGLIGLAINLSGIRLPDIIANDVVGKISSCANPIALIIMGAGFNFEYAGRYKKQIGIVAVCRLVLVPLVEIPIMILLGFRGVDLLALTICAATPTAVNSYSTAVSMGGDGDLAGAIVAITSICSVLTIFLWVSVLSMLGVL